MGPQNRVPTLHNQHQSDGSQSVLVPHVPGAVCHQAGLGAQAPSPPLTAGESSVLGLDPVGDPASDPVREPGTEAVDSCI